MDWGGPQGPPPGPGGWGGPPGPEGWGGPPPGPGGWGGPPGPGGWGPNPNDVEYVQEDRPATKMTNALSMCCMGVLLFPVALFVLGWNEVGYVCTHKSILFAQKRAEVIGCEPRTSWYPNMVAYMSCPIHEDSLEVFTPQSFGSTGLHDAISFRAASGSQTSEMFQCVEHSETQEDRHSKEKVRIYSYSMEWSLHPVDSSTFSYNGQAQSAGNPPWPADISSYTSDNFAQSIRAGPLTIGHDLIAGGSHGYSLKPDEPVNLQPFATRFRPFNQLAPTAPPGGFSSITPNSAAIDPSGKFVVTCARPSIGCMRISYSQNSARSVSVLSGVEPGGYTKPIEVQSSWGCSAGRFSALMGEPMSLQAFSARLEEANSTSTWIIRVLGLCFAALTVYCCFAPISAAADVVGDYIRCIPCVGETLEDLLEGMVDALLCAVSCAFGCSCGLLVIAITWLVMRPLIGGGVLLVCLVLFCCGYAIAHQNKANRDAGRSFSGDVEMNKNYRPGMQAMSDSDGEE
ncbi:unnamed protein product [Durusdinium trenchii]|uniref:Transmembrane protein n=1 Tax=Durusdinium trenchii TaxID=1381693 RepID=A0ABP0HYH8_9DINO